MGPSLGKKYPESIIIIFICSAIVIQHPETAQHYNGLMIHGKQ